MLALAGSAAGAAATSRTRLNDTSARDDGRIVREREHQIQRRPSGGTLDRIDAAAFDLGARFGAVARGALGADGDLSTLDASFESLPLLPANIANTLDTVVWGGAAAGVTGRPNFAAASSPLTPPNYGVIADGVGGNATQMLRGYVTSPGMAGDNYFGRWLRYDLYRTNTASPTQSGATRFVFGPDSGQDVRVVHDTYLTSIDSLWTSEPTYVGSGFIVARLLWGGENTTTGLGLPVGPILHLHTLIPGGFFGGIFAPCATPATYRSGLPFPGGAGQLVAPPIGQWFKIIHEFPIDGTVRHVLDLNDGHGEFVIHEFVGIQLGRVDRMAFSGAFETPGDAMHVDNMHFEGVEYRLPVPPPLECIGGMFADNLEWLNGGALMNQNPQWFDALSARATVEDIGTPQRKVIRRENFFNDDRYRRENSRALPLTIASGVGSFRACVRTRIPSSQFAPNSTVQGIAPVSIADNAFVTRIFIGRFTPGGAGAYTPRVYVQINPLYQPIDDEATLDPYLPGPNGNGGIPVVGADVADTGVNWTFNAFRDVCFDVNSSAGLVVRINGVAIHTGTSFVNSIDRLDLECENNQPGVGDTIEYDDVSLLCSVLPPVTLPPLTLVYIDNLGWGYDGVTIGLHDDDNNPNTPFRWSSAPNMPLVGTPTNFLRLENLFRDTSPALPSEPEFMSFMQASTALPHVEAGPTRGWVARCDNRLTDAETSRTWAAAQAGPAPGEFARVAALTFSSVTETFWFQRPAPTAGDPFATAWEDTGASFASLFAAPNQTFNLSIARSLSGKCTFRFNGQLLRHATGPNAGQAVVVDPLGSFQYGVHKHLDRLIFLSSDEDTAPVGSALLVDNLRAWSLPCLGDTNNDGLVNFTDLNNVLGFFGVSVPPGQSITGNIAPDTNNDGVPDDNAVTFVDLNTVLSGFGVPCTSTQ